MGTLILVAFFVGVLVGAFATRAMYRDEICMRGHGRWNPITRDFEWKDRAGTGWEKP